MLTFITKAAELSIDAVLTHAHLLAALTL